MVNEASVAGCKAAFAALGALKEVNLQGSQETFVAAFREPQLRGSRGGPDRRLPRGLPRYILEVLFILAVGLVLLVAARARTAGSGGAIGVLALFVAAGFRMLPRSLCWWAARATSGSAPTRWSSSAPRCCGPGVTTLAEEDKPVRLPFSRELRLDGVWFRYPESGGRRPA